MSEIMRPMSIGHLMHWIMSEYEQKKSIFGIEKIVKHENGQALPIAYQYDTETGIIKNATLVSLGTFKTTAYCPCRSCSEGYGRLTKTGTQATASRTVAVDPRVIPLGSHLLIDGVEYIAEDVGGGVKGKHIDIFYNTLSETKNHGVERSEVYLIQS